MAARKRPAAKDHAGRFTEPWVWTDSRGSRAIYYVDPLTSWEDQDRQPKAGWRSRLGNLVCRMLGVGD